MEIPEAIVTSKSQRSNNSKASDKSGLLEEKPNQIIRSGDSPILTGETKSSGSKSTFSQPRKAGEKEKERYVPSDLFAPTEPFSWAEDAPPSDNKAFDNYADALSGIKKPKEKRPPKQPKPSEPKAEPKSAPSTPHVPKKFFFKKEKLTEEQHKQKREKDKRKDGKKKAKRGKDHTPKTNTDTWLALTPQTQTPNIIFGERPPDVPKHEPKDLLPEGAEAPETKTFEAPPPPIPQPMPPAPDVRVQYKAMVVSKNWWAIHPYTDRKFWVYERDVDWLMSNEPVEVNSHSMLAFQRLVGAKYHLELSLLWRNDRALWKERLDGLNCWPTHELFTRFEARDDVCDGASELLQRHRLARAGLDKVSIFSMAYSWMFILIAAGLVALACWIPAAINTALMLTVGLSTLWLSRSRHNKKMKTIFTLALAFTVFTILSWTFSYRLLIPAFCAVLIWFKVVDPRYIHRPVDWQGTFALCATYPRVSAILEEVLKCIPFMWMVIGYLEYLKYGTWHQYNYHRRSMKHSFMVRLRRHLAWNTPLRNTGSRPLFEWFCNWIEHGGEFTPPSIEEEAVIEQIPSRGQGYGGVGIVDPLGTPMLVQQTKAGYFALYHMVVPFAKTAATHSNVKACFETRVCSVPNTDCNAPHNTLLRIAGAISLQILPPYVNRGKWWDHLKPRQQRVIEASQTKAFRGIIEDKIECFVKTELLIDNGLKFIARPIMNVSGQWSDRIGPYMWTLQKAFAKTFNGVRDSFDVNGIAVHIFYACSATNRRLESFWREANESGPNTAWLLIMGDDLAGVINYQKRRFIIESDFSKFDRTQNSRLLELCFRFFGDVFPDHADEYRELYRLPLDIYLDKAYPKFSDLKTCIGNMRLTGESGTSLMNSYVNAIATIYVLAFLHPRDSAEVVDGYKTMGLNAKVAYYRTDKQHATNYPNPAYRTDPPVTFLKGVFLRDGAQWYWIRLPSFLCKFGHTMKDCTITDRRGISHDEKRRCALWSQWMGFGQLKTLTYSYAQIHEHLKRLTNCDQQPAELEEWQIRVYKHERPISQGLWYAFLNDRYKIDPVEWCNFIRSYTSHQRVGIIFTHPVGVTLALRDYG